MKGWTRRGCSDMAPLLVSLIAAFSLSPSCVRPDDSGQDRKVTFECAGVYAGRALEELSKVAGVRIAAGATTSEEVFAISVKDVPLSELLAKIALAANAEWQHDDKNGYLLIRSASLLQKQQREHLALKAEAIRKGQEAARKRIKDKPDYDEAAAKKLAVAVEAYLDTLRQNPNDPGSWRMQANFLDRFPATMLGDRLAVLLDPNDLASIEEGDRAVYALSPTRMQRPLPKAAVAELKRYLENVQKLATAFAGKLDEDTARYGDSRLYGPFKYKTPEEATPTQVILKVTTGIEGRYSFQLVVGNAKGDTIGQSYGSLSAQTNVNAMVEKPDPAPEGEKPLALDAVATELTEALQTAIRRGGKPEDIPEISPELRDRLLSPEKHNIAEIGAAQLLIGAAKARNENLVATVPDLIGFFMPIVFAMGSTTPTQVLKIASADLPSLTLQEGGGWMTLRPSDPVQARLMHVDPKALGKLVRSAVQNGFLPLDDLAEFAVSLPGNANNTIAVPYLMILAPSGIGDYERLSSAFLKLHGSLSPQQKQAMANGRKLSLTQMTPLQRTRIEKIVYGDRQPGVSFKQPKKPADLDPYNSIGMEPTIRYGNGLPSDTLLGMKYESGINVRAVGTYNGQNSMMSDLTIESLAYYWESKDRATGNTVYTSFAAEDKTQYLYELDMDDLISYHGELGEHKPRGKPVSSPDKLPADIWKQVLAMVDKIKADRNAGRIPPRR